MLFQNRHLVNGPPNPPGRSEDQSLSDAGREYPASTVRSGGSCHVADALTTPDRILILSALHGLLPLDEVIAPYELRMGQPGSIGAGGLGRQLAMLSRIAGTGLATAC
jgi:hypothetical protein